MLRGLVGIRPVLISTCILRRSKHTMRLVQFVESGRQRVGVEIKDGGDVVDVSAGESSIPSDMRSFLSGGEDMMNRAQRVVDSGQHVLKRSDVQLKAPIHNPEKLICIGMNYVDHCLEQNVPLPTEPILFSKFNNAITDPGTPIIYPDETQELDFEVELAFVIGKAGKKIKESEAMDYVAGYTVVHDVSARDWQLKKNSGQWLIGKTFDSFCPIGPAIVTKDSLSDPHKLGIRCRVNGNVMQESNTENLVFKTEKLISFISRFVSVTPGDVVITGTPPGVGCFRKPPVYLKVFSYVLGRFGTVAALSNPHVISRTVAHWSLDVTLLEKGRSIGLDRQTHDRIMVFLKLQGNIKHEMEKSGAQEKENFLDKIRLPSQVYININRETEAKETKLVH